MAGSKLRRKFFPLKKVVHLHIVNSVVKSHSSSCSQSSGQHNPRHSQYK